MMKGIIERKCRPDDEKFFVDLMDSTMKDTISANTEYREDIVRERFRNKVNEMVVLMKDSDPIGVYHLSQTDDALAVDRFFLKPEYQRQGIGTAYMQRFEEIAREKGCARVTLQVWENNPALRLYERLGYVKTGEPRPHKIAMEKKLQK